MKKLNFSVSVLILREENRWVAQCLEYDIAAQADSIAALKNAFAKAFVSQVVVNVRHGKKPLHGVPKAPAYYQKMFKKAELFADRPTFTTEPLIPEVNVIARTKEMRLAA